MKQFLIILFFIAFSGKICAQEKEIKGTIETLDGIKTDGFILIRSQDVNSELISFRANQNSEYKDYFPNDLTSYTLNEDLYESQVLDSVRRFLMVIVKGKASLYQIKINKKTRFYLKMQDEEKIYWLRHETVTIINGEHESKKLVSFYKEILRDKLVGCDLGSDSNLHTNSKSLRSYITKYNDCFSGNNFEQKKESTSVFFGLTGGLLQYKGGLLPGNDLWYESTNFASGGFAFDFKPSRRKMLLTSLSYRFNKGNYKDPDTHVVVSSSQAHVISYQGNFILAKSRWVEPFISLAPIVYFETESRKNKSVNEKENLLIVLFNIGCGVKINFTEKIFSKLIYERTVLFGRGYLTASLSYRIK